MVMRPNVYTRDHAAFDAATLERFETNGAARRRLHADLHEIDRRLQEWAPWARPRYAQLGYPTRAVTERAGEGGILAINTPRTEPEWPEQIARLDRLIARLPTRHLAAVMAAYFHAALPLEARALVYVRLTHYLLRTRPPAVPLARRTEAVGPSAFSSDLDRARWSLRLALLTHAHPLPDE